MLLVPTPVAADALACSDQNKIKPTPSPSTSPWAGHCTRARGTVDTPLQTYRYPQLHRDLPAKIRKNKKLKTKAKTKTKHPHPSCAISGTNGHANRIYNSYFPNFEGQGHPGETGGGLRRSKPQVPEVGLGNGEGGTESICMGSEHKEQLRGAGAPRAQSYKEAAAAHLIELGRPSPATRAPPASALPPVPVRRRRS